MMKRNLWTLVLIFSLVLNVTFVISFAMRSLRSKTGFAYEELDLSPEQQARLEAGRDGFVQTVNQSGNRMIRFHTELLDLLAADAVDHAAVEAKLNEISANHRAMQRAIVEHLLADREVLSPEQRQQFFAVLKERMRAQGAPGPAWVPREARQRE